MSTYRAASRCSVDNLNIIIFLLYIGEGLLTRCAGHHFRWSNFLQWFISLVSMANGIEEMNTRFGDGHAAKRSGVRALESLARFNYFTSNSIIPSIIMCSRTTDMVMLLVTLGAKLEDGKSFRRRWAGSGFFVVNFVTLFYIITTHYLLHIGPRTSL